ncbi:MAG: thioester dehydrase [Sneathiella sp.]|nr:MAG: thioester dehydrase [Sneathiella sp.]
MMSAMDEKPTQKWAESRTEPEILRETRSEGPDGPVIELQLRASEDLFQFQGHFPGEPILPGVAQLDWVARLSARYLGCGDHIGKLGQLKFSKLITAGEELTLRLAYDTKKNRISFSYRDGTEICSSGYLVLARE